EWAEADSFPTRVRLPDEPLMLVDRIVFVEGTPRSLSRGRVVTEHDVREGAWYLDLGRAPVWIAVECGQADLFLSGYLGIDLATRGERRYRLLDAVVTFHRDLPRPGEVVRYEIEIDRFVRQGSTYLFFFRFEGFVGDVPLLSMTEGCAGFFSQEQLDGSSGIVLTAEETAPEPGKAPRDEARGLPRMEDESLDDEAISALRRGHLERAFGGEFAGLPLREPAGLPGGRMKLIDRVLAIEPRGGRFGLGRIHAEADVNPGDWYLTCHFVDDQVMPGTLMYECCLHALRVLLMRRGWVAERGEVGFEPVPGVPGRLRCRGQVTPGTRKVHYEIDVKEIGYRPEPYAVADALMFADGKRIVRMTDMSLRLVGLSRERVEEIWRWREPGARRAEGLTFSDQEWDREGVGGDPERGGAVPLVLHPSPLPRRQSDSGAFQVAPPNPSQPSSAPPPFSSELDPNTDDRQPTRTLSSKAAVFSREKILAFAIGKPSEAFGEPYRVFDEERVIARLPGPPYQFLDRITDVSGARAWKLEAGSWIEAQYDVPGDAWYFPANRQESMPMSVLLEVALQPCGWLAAYLGSALESEIDLSFRNLGGRAVQREEVFPGAGTLTTRARLTSTSEAGGMIVQKYDFLVSREGRTVYDGETSFGFFSKAALAQQVGVHGARERVHVPNEAETARGVSFALADARPFEPDDETSERAPALALPGRAYRMVDEVALLVEDGGPRGLGFVRGTKDVDPGAWFFRAHFFQDPVWPGSLGLESFLQILKAYAVSRWGKELESTHRFEPILLGSPHEWTYRGQILPSNRRVTVEACVTERKDGERPELRANGFLSVDGTIIYEMTDFGLRLVPAREGAPA
ncbi:type I polyketide synthase, partial [bacterium]|nr:type I polyketide synthase [bacterium]